MAELQFLHLKMEAHSYSVKLLLFGLRIKKERTIKSFVNFFSPISFVQMQNPEPFAGMHQRSTKTMETAIY